MMESNDETIDTVVETIKVRNVISEAGSECLRNGSTERSSKDY
jgi:hypothetical protein